MEEFGCDLVEITGGEPLIHPNAFLLTLELLDRGYTVLVETSGAVDVGPSGSQGPQDHGPEVPRVRGGRAKTSGPTWTTSLSGDEVKFVLKDREDYDWACRVIRERGLKERMATGTLRALLFSPVWGELELGAAGGMDPEGRSPVRLQIQLHKLIWDPKARGV